MDFRLSPPLDTLVRPSTFLGPGGRTASPAQASSLFGISNGLEVGVTWQRGEVVVQALQENQQRNDAIDRALYDDINIIETANAQINQTNDRVLPLLETLTGQTLGADPESWRKWWSEQLGYVFSDQSSQSKSYYSDTVEEPESTVILPTVAATVVLTHSCFAAGTLVRTFGGPRKIESIAAGDRVLSQQSSTGTLSFQPVLATHLNGPAETFRNRVGR